MRVKIGFLLLPLIWILTISCGKKNGIESPDNNKPEPELPEGEDIIEKDITKEARLVVSHENFEGASGIEGSHKLIDGSVDTKFMVNTFRPGMYMELQFKEPKQIGAYTITSGNDNEGRDPMNWVILGSIDKNKWDTLDFKMGELFFERKMTRKYSFVNKKQYPYYRWVVNKTYYQDTDFQVAELGLIQVPGKKQANLPSRLIDSTKQDGLTLYFINKGARVPQTEKMKTAFFKVYPQLLKEFNPDATKAVHFVIDPDYDGVAYAISNVVVYSHKSLMDYPNEADVVVHEIMHLIQAYPSGAAPGWLSEGIADYIRYKYGQDRESGWSLPDFRNTDSYTDAYRVTARFLVWIEKRIKKSFVKEVDAAIRNKTYSTNFWIQHTGMSVDELWKQYASDPVI